MSAVKSISGRGIPLRGSDIDTDRIIPARFLRCVTFDGLGDSVFADDRAAKGGTHAFDQPQYEGANILIVNDNFGCGSSREHAPQALVKWGIQAIVGESFAEIFFGNCVALGVPCVMVTPEAAAQLQEAIATQRQTHIEVNLEALTVTAGDLTLAIAMPDGPRQMLLTGKWDSCGQLVANAEAVKATAQTLPYLGWSA